MTHIFGSGQENSQLKVQISCLLSVQDYTAYLQSHFQQVCITGANSNTALKCNYFSQVLRKTLETPSHLNLCIKN